MKYPSPLPTSKSNVTAGSLLPYLIATFVLILPIIFVARFVDNELVASADIVLHLNRIISSANSLREGLFWPRWYPDMFIGYGYPLPHFYPPGASLVGAVFVLAGISPLTALILTQILALWTGASGAFMFAREFGEPPAALVTATVYLYVPFLFFQLYHIGNVPQLLAFNLLPWCLWGIARGARTQRVGYTAFTALALVFALFMHQLAGLMAVGVSVIYALVAAFSASQGTFWRNRFRYTVPLTGVFLGVLLATIWWFPAIADADVIQPLSNTTAFHGANIEENFLLLSQILEPARTVDQTAQVPLFRLSFGLPQLVLLLLSVLMLPRFILAHARWQYMHIVMGTIGVVILLYLMTYYSFSLWKKIPGVDVVLQPWRLFGLVYAIMIPGTALFLNWLIHQINVWITPILIFIILSTILPVVLPAVENVQGVEDLRTPADMILYENRTGNYGSVVFDEYRPTALRSIEELTACAECYADWQWRVYPQDSYLPEDASIQINETSRRRSTLFTLSTPTQFDFVMHQFYFPGWRALLNGEPIPLAPTTSAGLMTATIPAGTHDLEVWYAGTPTTSVAFMISVWAFAIIGALGFHEWRTGRRQSKRALLQPIRDHRVLWVCILMVMAFSVVLNFYVEPHTDWFRASNPPDAPRYMQHAQRTVFVDERGDAQIELLGYDLNVDSVSSGDWLFVDLYWRAIQPQETDWRVHVELADTVFGEPFMADDNPTPGRIPTSGWSLENYIFDRHILRIDETIPPYLSQIEVEIYAEDQAPLTTEAGTPAAVLTTMRIHQEFACDTTNAVNVKFGELLTIKQVALNSQPDDTLVLDLCWDVEQTTENDFRLFIHFYEDNSFIEAADQPPIERYPTQTWEAGQTLNHEYVLQVPPDANALHIGLYDALTGERLPVLIDGNPAQNGSLILALPGN